MACLSSTLAWCNPHVLILMLDMIKIKHYQNRPVSTLKNWNKHYMDPDGPWQCFWNKYYIHASTPVTLSYADGSKVLKTRSGLVLWWYYINLVTKITVRNYDGNCCSSKQSRHEQIQFSNSGWTLMSLWQIDTTWRHQNWSIHISTCLDQPRGEEFGAMPEPVVSRVGRAKYNTLLPGSSLSWSHYKKNVVSNSNYGTCTIMSHMFIVSGTVVFSLSTVAEAAGDKYV